MTDFEMMTARLVRAIKSGNKTMMDHMAKMGENLLIRKGCLKPTKNEHVGHFGDTIDGVVLSEFPKDA